MSLFYNSTANKDAERLKHVLIADKHFNPENITQVIKSDIFHLLSSYACLNSEDVFVSIQLNSNGSYHFKIEAECSDLKIFGALPDDYY